MQSLDIGCVDSTCIDGALVLREFREWHVTELARTDRTHSSRSICAKRRVGVSGVVARFLGVSSSSRCIPSRIFPIALSGLLTASWAMFPVRWKNLRVLSREGKTSGLAASSPGVESNGDMDAGGSDLVVLGDGGSS